VVTATGRDGDDLAAAVRCYLPAASFSTLADVRDLSAARGLGWWTVSPSTSDSQTAPGEIRDKSFQKPSATG
jgi:transcription-repair coupling factor (superfamily II helicase)